MPRYEPIFASMAGPEVGPTRWTGSRRSTLSQWMAHLPWLLERSSVHGTQNSSGLLRGAWFSGLRGPATAWLFGLVFLLVGLAASCSDDTQSTEPDANVVPGVCGNGVLDPGEECDEGSANSDARPDACRTDCRLARCGDSVADSDEECDGMDTKGQVCADLDGFDRGDLSCRRDCTLDTSGCSGCGNGVAEGQKGGNGYEECDGDDLRGATCEDQGRPIGQLLCTEDCHYDFRYCTGILPPAITAIHGTGASMAINPRPQDQQAFQNLFDSLQPWERHLSDQRIGSQDQEIDIEGTSLGNVESVTAQGQEGQGTFVFEIRGGTDTMLRLRFPSPMTVAATGLFTLVLVTSHGIAQADVFFLQGEQGPQGPAGTCTCDPQTLAPVVAGQLSQDATFIQDVAVSAADQAVPAGTVIAYAGDISQGLPDGWLLCDGSEVLRATYPRLFAAIGVAHGIGDGVSTFNLPDLRGRFLRGVDMGTGRDPDAALREAPSDGANEGDTVGSIQEDAFTRHSHGVNDPGHSHAVRVNNWSTNCVGLAKDDGCNSGFYDGNLSPWHFIATAQTGITIQESGNSTETRPKNVSIYYLIKY